MPQPVEPWSHVVRLGDTSRALETFELVPDAETRAALAERLDIPKIRKLRFAGRLEPHGRRDWYLFAELGATVVQPCSVTLAPVTSRLDESIERRYLAALPEAPEEGEVEMPDETVEPLPATLDLGAVMAEALLLALPQWPRAEGVEADETAFAAPGVKPMRDEDTRPFAGLGKLMGDREDDG
ncbi:YceD family protein [Roseitranquillus sediminis]|uniref:YceD family protein n=1 Tax=Roseitranquillus sediminis TaxID=2809051 RepID=UPI001D0C83AE|nr:DUF177 domain-containing protein [Roseitranquillus sediminis]MBM9595013.1 DUF177 domain-containing protein [Roseitranquillus sediminis]